MKEHMPLGGYKVNPICMHTKDGAQSYTLWVDNQLRALLPLGFKSSWALLQPPPPGNIGVECHLWWTLHELCRAILLVLQKCELFLLWLRVWGWRPSGQHTLPRTPPTLGWHCWVLVQVRSALRHSAWTFTAPSLTAGNTLPSSLGNLTSHCRNSLQLSCIWLGIDKGLSQHVWDVTASESSRKCFKCWISDPILQKI